MSEDVVVVGEMKSNFDSHDGPATEAVDPGPEPPTDATAVNEDDTWSVGGFLTQSYDYILVFEP